MCPFPNQGAGPGEPECKASLTGPSQTSRSKAESHAHRHEAAMCLADSGLLEVGFGLSKEGMWIVEATAACFSTSVLFFPLIFATSSLCLNRN